VLFVFHRMHLRLNVYLQLSIYTFYSPSRAHQCREAVHSWLGWAIVYLEDHRRNVVDALRQQSKHKVG